MVFNVIAILRKRISNIQHFKKHLINLNIIHPPEKYSFFSFDQFC